MSLLKPRAMRVVSKGFDLRQKKEAETGERLSLEDISKETELSRMTVRRFIVNRDADVSGSPLLAAAVVAGYFGVPLGDLLVVEEAPSVEGQEAAA